LILLWPLGVAAEVAAFAFLFLVREGLAAVLREAGIDVVGKCASGDDLLLKVRSTSPTSPSSTSACRRRTRMRACRRPGRILAVLTYLRA
jgi:hypothetical protein